MVLAKSSGFPLKRDKPFPKLQRLEAAAWSAVTLTSPWIFPSQLAGRLLGGLVSPHNCISKFLVVNYMYVHVCMYVFI